MHRCLLPLCALCLGFSLSFTAPALAVEAMELKVSRQGDVEMDCGHLSEEALLMREIIVTTEDIKDDSHFREHGINAAAGIGSFLIGSATGGIGLAAAGFLVNQTNKEGADDADNVQDIAEQRRSFMVGIYNAKGCFGPIEHVMRDSTEHLDSATIQIASIEPAAGEQHEDEQMSAPEPHYNQ